MNILIVDDHPMNVELYENVLLQDFASYKPLVITKAFDCKGGYIATEYAKLNHELFFDLAILDYSLPTYQEKNILSGADLANLIRKYFENCKIIIITSHTQKLLVYDIIRKIKPEGIAVKADVTTSSFSDLITHVLEGNLYQSVLVKEYVSEIWKKELMVEDTNRQILFYLAKGYRVKELEEVIPLAASTIQRRIVDLKKIFGVLDDSTLVKEVIRQGFL
jgi:DNA-binding NarL/FixJ family response regulator